MLSDTLQDELATYRIAEKLRALRRRKRLRLAELASHTGLSTAMLSKLETGKMVPTLPTLTRIALVFSVGLDYFFTDEARQHPVTVVRRDDRIRLPAGVDQEPAPYEFESLDYPVTDRQLSGYFAEFNRVDDPQPHEHPGEEIIYVISGTLRLVVRDEELLLRAGDSAHFRSHVPHHYSARGAEPCTAVVVTTERD